MFLKEKRVLQGFGNSLENITFLKNISENITLLEISIGITIIHEYREIRNMKGEDIEKTFKRQK